MQKIVMLKHLFSKRLQLFTSLLLFIVVFLFASRHSAKGIDLTDEGMYLSTAMRYSLGDIPFKDEMMNIMRPFDVLSSLIFRVFPDITLLQIRHLGLVLHALSLILYFLLMSRYASPFFVAILSSIMFLTNNFWGIFTPSYNSLSSDFALISLTLWSFAFLSRQTAGIILLSAAGGIALSIAVISYPPLVTMTTIPILLIIFRYFNRTYREYLLPSIIFIATFILVIGMSLFTIYLSGLWPSFTNNLLMASTITDLSHVGPWSKMGALFKEYKHIASSGFLLTIPLFYLFVLIDKKLTDRNYKVILTIIIAILYLSLFLYDRFLARLSHHFIPYIILSSTIPLVLLTVFIQRWNSSRDVHNEKWEIIRNLSMTWSIVLLLSYGFASSNGLKASIQGLTPLFLITFVALYRMNTVHITIYKAYVMQRRYLELILILLTISFFLAAIKYYFHTVYPAQDVSNLTTQFHHPKLKGIYSTSENVEIIEDLLHYLQTRVNKNDYLLAYNHVPLLYYLTDTRPAYGAAWTIDDWPMSLRDHVVKEMINKGRIPEYCVRMLAFPYSTYLNYGLAYDENSPLDNFVQSNYYLEKIIYPFQIWRLGPGPKYQVFEQQTPVFKDLFVDWKGRDLISSTDFNSIDAITYQIVDVNNSFLIERFDEDHDRKILRITKSYEKTSENDEVRISYLIPERILMNMLGPQQEIVLTMIGRISWSGKNLYTPHYPQVFIEDGTDKSRINKAALFTSRWDHYTISKSVSKNSKNISIGFIWNSESLGDYFEIKDVRVYSR